MKKRFGWLPFQRRRSPLMPGWGINLGFSLTYLSLLVLLPLAALFAQTLSMSWSEFWAVASDPRVIASLKLTFGTAALAAMINSVLGFVVAWVLVRYQFWGRRFFDAIIDIPFALPTAVSGIALTAIYTPQGWLGQFLYPWGLQTAFSRLGILLAMIFIGLPFVVRTLQPAIADIDRDTEEAAAHLGANRSQIFLRVILPMLLPAWWTGLALAFARAVGEYGSIIFIAGNQPLKTEITSLLIVTKLEQFDYNGAAAIAIIMLIASFVLLLAINLVQWWTTKRSQAES